MWRRFVSSAMMPLGNQALQRLTWALNMAAANLRLCGPSHHTRRRLTLDTLGLSIAMRRSRAVMRVVLQPTRATLLLTVTLDQSELCSRARRMAISTPSPLSSHREDASALLEFCASALA